MMSAVEIGLPDTSAEHRLPYDTASNCPCESKLPTSSDDLKIPTIDEELTVATDALSCPVCTNLLTHPITLSCGFSVCTSCLPQFDPATVQNFDCPVPECVEKSHLFGELKLDVTIHKLAEIISDETISNRRLLSMFKAIQSTDRPLSSQDYLYIAQQQRKGRSPSSSPMSMEPSIESDCTLLDCYSDAENQLPWKSNMLNELECQVCYCLLNEPLTIPCGHTFCKACLLRFADHSNVCAICRSHLPIPRVLQAHPSNATLSYLISTLFSFEQMERQEALKKEEELASSYTPIFVCSIAYPTIPSYLHVFEPRYRLMIRRCIQPGGTRQFGMCIGLPNKTFSDVGTMLKIENVEPLNDGRYLVKAVGSFRFRIKNRGMRDGYHTAQVERFDDDFEEDVSWKHNSWKHNYSDSEHHLTGSRSIEDMVKEASLFGKLLQMSSAPWILQRIIRTNSKMPTDPNLLSWWIAATIPMDDQEKLPILELTSVCDRLGLICDWIAQVKEQWWFQPLCMIQQ